MMSCIICRHWAWGAKHQMDHIACSAVDPSFCRGWQRGVGQAACQRECWHGLTPMWWIHRGAADQAGQAMHGRVPQLVCACSERCVAVADAIMTSQCCTPLHVSTCCTFVIPLCASPVLQARKTICTAVTALSIAINCEMRCSYDENDTA